MNNNMQGQPPQGQPGGAQPPQQQQQQKRQIIMYRPEQMRSLPDQFSQAEKEKWEIGLRSLWNTLENNTPETQQHQDAKRKLFDFSKNLTQKIQSFRMQAAQATQAAQQAGGARPTPQGQPQSQAEGSSGANVNQAQQRPQPKVPPKILDHVNTFQYVVPPQITQGSPEAGKWLQEAKGRYMKALISMENASMRLAGLDAIQQKRNEEGKPFSPEEEKDFKEKRDATQKQHVDSKTYVESFRQQQRIASQKANQQGSGQQQGGGNNPNGGQAPARPQMNLQQPPNPALQNTQTVNAAIEAARNQQMGVVRPPGQQNGQQQQMPNTPSNPQQQQQQAQQQQQHQAQQQQQAQQTQQQAQQQGGQVQNIKQEAGVPQINTQIQRPVQNNSPQSAVPQSAQSSGTQPGAPQVPRPLTHQAALQTAARTYSNGQASGSVNAMGHSHTHPTPRETQNVMTNKMPIPKQLPERAIATPQGVPVSQPRPTFSGGPSNSGNGVMSQPILQRTPGYHMEGDGNSVLSKKKLDELVRQVTGGGDGLGGGESLTPEVEESILSVADEFVDQVLQSACKIAKERGSKLLEVRDIQLTLERSYNIRIPGYASDEIRTVRKILPTGAWINKMSAVQASKVTGSKNAD